MAPNNSYTIDPDEMQGLPPLASPLMASGVDPEEAKLTLFGMPRSQAAAGAPPVAEPAVSRPAMSPSAAAAGAIGGAGATPAVPASSVMPAPAPANDGLTDLQRKAFEQGMSIGQQQLGTANQEGQVPQNIETLQQQRLKDEAATPQPQDYKPSFGQRVLRGLRGTLVGGLTGGVPGLLTGAVLPGNISGGKAYGAPTDAYDQALGRQKATVANDTESLSNALANFKTQQDALKARQAGLKNADTTSNNVATGITGEQNAVTKAAEVPISQQNANTNAYKAWAEGPDGKLKLTQDEIDLRTAIANRNRMPAGFNRTRYILTGEMQPAHEPSAEEIALGQATQLFVRKHGHRPETLADYQSVVAAAKGRAGSTGNRGADANLRAAAANAKAVLDSLRANFSKAQDYMAPEDEQAAQAAIGQAQKNYDGLQQQLVSGGGNASAGQAPGNPLVGPIRDGEQTSVGPNGHRIVWRSGKWVDPQNGKAIQ